jgi:SAM-dependent methyltransferase
MTRAPSDYADQILRDYASMEPGEADTWNPVGNETELGYRMSFLFVLTKCLELADIPCSSLKVLDVGCGTGRSTRVYLDLGLEPSQLTAVDLRPGTIARARKLHPSIDFRAYDGGAIDVPAASFNWVQFSTVFSSVADHGHRAYLAEQAFQLLQPEGYVFYFDLWRANPFAGSDRLHPEAIFSAFRPVWASSIRSHTCFPAVQDRWKLQAGDTPIRRFRSWLAPRTRLRRLLAPSHYVMLARKPSTVTAKDTSR